MVKRLLLVDDAGTPGAYASIMHHVGRTSGDPYETPVVAVPALRLRGATASTT